jgi:hypothetical protein
MAIRRYWTVGYQAQPIISLFHSLPRRLRAAITEAIDAVQRSTEHTVIEAPGANNQPDSTAAAEEWNADAVHGFVCTNFDPTSQARVRVTANARAAELLGMHREELLARYTRRDVPLALPPLDALRAFIHGLLRTRDADATRYYRIVPPPPGDGRAAPPPALVCATSARILDPFGRVVQATLPRFPTPL